MIRIMTVGTYIVFGFLKGFQPFAEYNYGAKQFERLNAVLFAAFGFRMVYASLYLSIGKSLVGGLLSLSWQGVFFCP